MIKKDSQINLNYLNLGCGGHYSIAKEWTNLDFVKTGPGIIAHNLLNGIPFEDESFLLVYHSHVLEHFSKKDGEEFIKECFRVLKPGGIIRVAVPDLEMIAQEYLRNLKLALEGNIEAGNNYDWIKLEMYDQTVRNVSGGAMANYLFQNTIPNESYVFNRLGDEARNLRSMYLINRSETNSPQTIQPILRSTKKYSTSYIKFRINSKIKNLFFKSEIRHFDSLKREATIGKFRLSGEIHQWMYDRYSLARLLEDTGFSSANSVDAFSSGVSGWINYGLDAIEGIVRKPDSLFMEAIK